MKKPRLFNIDQCYRSYLTLAMVKKLRLFNPRHKTSIIMKNTCEEPKLLNPRHKALVIMKDKFKLLNHGHNNILITKGVLAPKTGLKTRMEIKITYG